MGPVLDVILEYWTVALFLPIVVIVLSTLAVITRLWDRK